MSVALFKPAVWSANLLVALRNNLVSENFVNHDYQGETTYYLMYNKLEVTI